MVTACTHAYPCTLQPVASTFHISSVAVISRRALCVVSTGLNIIIHAIESPSPLPMTVPNCRFNAAIVLRRPTARFKSGVCLSVCPFPRQHQPSHLPNLPTTFPRHRDPFHLASARYCASASPRSPLPARQITQISNICHLHDGLDCPRETRHSSCHLSVRDMLPSTSVSFL